MSSEYIKAICVGVVGATILGTTIVLNRKRKYDVKSVTPHQISGTPDDKKRNTHVVPDKFRDNWVANERQYIASSGPGRKLFYKKERQILKRCGLSSQEIFQQIQKKWRNLSPVEKFE